jgi:hypothetical protein
MGTEISKRLNSLPKAAASFVEPMECLSVSKLPAGSQWVWEIKLDGYRALAVKSERGVTLLSRRRKSLNRQSPYIVELLNDLPAGRSEMHNVVLPRGKSLPSGVFPVLMASSPEEYAAESCSFLVSPVRISSPAY